MKQIQLGFVAEETGFVDGQIFQQLGQFLLAFFADQQTVVAVERIEMTFFQAPLQTVLKKMGAPLVEVHAALLVDEHLQKLQLSLVKLRRCAGCAHSSHDFQFVVLARPVSWPSRSTAKLFAGGGAARLTV